MKNKTNSEHSNRFHSSETFHLTILSFILHLRFQDLSFVVYVNSQWLMVTCRRRNDIFVPLTFFTPNFILINKIKKKVFKLLEVV